MYLTLGLRRMIVWWNHTKRLEEGQSIDIDGITHVGSLFKRVYEVEEIACRSRMPYNAALGEWRALEYNMITAYLEVRR